MLGAIKRFFEEQMQAGGSAAAAPGAAAPDAGPPVADGHAAAQHDPVHVAAAALLLELAHADDEFTEDERAHLEESLTRHFDLTPETARELMGLAEEERQRAVDLFQFTRLIAERYDEGQKMVLAEVMWRLVYADGELAKHESYLVRKVSNLLGLRPGYLAQAKQRAVSDREA